MKNNRISNQIFVAMLLWLLFDFRGRISREVFWLSNVLVFVFALLVFRPYIVAFFDQTIEQTSGQIEQSVNLLLYQMWINPITMVLILVMQWCQLVILAKRAHDRNLTGLISLLLLLPYINLGMLLIFGIIKGDPKPNRFGPVPN